MTGHLDETWDAPPVVHLERMNEQCICLRVGADFVWISAKRATVTVRIERGALGSEPQRPWTRDAKRA